jgi:hypothetical protein
VDPLVADELEFTTADSLAEAENMVMRYTNTGGRFENDKYDHFDAKLRIREEMVQTISDCEDSPKESCTEYKRLGKCKTDSKEETLPCKKTCNQCGTLETTKKATFVVKKFRGSGKCGHNGNASSSKNVKVNEWTLLTQYGVKAYGPQTSTRAKRKSQWQIYYIYIMVGDKKECETAKNKKGQRALKDGEYCIMLDKRRKKFSCTYLKKTEQTKEKPIRQYFSYRDIYAGTNFLKQQKCVPGGRGDKKYLNTEKKKGDWFWTTACTTKSTGSKWKYCDNPKRETVRMSTKVSFDSKLNKALVGFSLLSPDLPTPPPAFHSETDRFREKTEAGYLTYNYPKRIGVLGECFSKCRDLPFFLLDEENTQRGRDGEEDDGRDGKWAYTCLQSRRIGCLHNVDPASNANVKFFNTVFRLQTGGYKPLQCCEVLKKPRVQKYGAWLQHYPGPRRDKTDKKWCMGTKFYTGTEFYPK